MGDDTYQSESSSSLDSVDAATTIPIDASSTGVDWRPPQAYTPYRPPANANGGTKPPKAVDSSLLPDGKKSLSGISGRSFVLGQVFGLSFALTAFLLWCSNPIWRAPFLLTTLTVFHFLEYYITARYNTPYASISAFLLSSNGLAYNIAHGSAMLECLLSRLVFPGGYISWTTWASGGAKVQIILGLALIVLGQVVRSLAMAQAGTNFTHTIQFKRREGHTLVTDGIYSILRHPSYFGFFWWGLGTQLVLGNAVCFCGYAIVLWQFFSHRIRREEGLLVGFFKDDYLEYKKKTRVGIPFIP
ncbi:hypothetical protein FQN52_004952 [Onygenales sp. PD_12]|nr:hypothetical protein FQN52_004952 [Onygenales sp. PD_12]